MLDAGTHATVHKKWYLFVSVLAASKSVHSQRLFLADIPIMGDHPAGARGPDQIAAA